MELAIGERIKALRLASDLTQEELAQRANLTRGFISQLENDQTSIQVDSLADLVDALGISLASFFADSDEVPVTYSIKDRVTMDNKGATRFEMLVPGSTNNIMDPIFVELQPGEQLAEEGSLPGEQFGYVLKGTLTLILDGEPHTVSKQQCFYFTADRPHQMKNENDRPVQFIWVTSPPLM